MSAALAVRFSVFVDEQGVPAADEIDEYDRAESRAVHALVSEIRNGNRTPLAAGRFYPLDERTVRIGRMAVMHAQRGRGLGRMVLEALVAQAHIRGYRAASLNAQVHALPFYEKARFEARGSEFTECGIVHRLMERAI